MNLTNSKKYNEGRNRKEFSKKLSKTIEDGLTKEFDTWLNITVIVTHPYDRTSRLLDPDPLDLVP